MRMTGKMTICLLVLAVAGLAYGDTVVIHGSADTQDAYLRAYAPTTAYGSNASLYLKGRYGTSTYWSCIKFDMPTLTAGEYVSEAVLEFNYYAYSGTGSDTSTWSLNQLLVPWVEAEVTWGSASNGTSWTGGDIAAKTGVIPDNYAAASLGSLSMNITNAYGWKSFSSTALASLINGMCHGMATNNGFLINRSRDYTDDNTYKFHSSDYIDDTSLQPKLTLTIGSEIVIQGSGDTQDAHASNYNLTTNYDEIGIRLNQRLTSSVYWGFIRFDLPTLTPGYLVSDAVLELYHYAGTNAASISVDLNQLLDPWVENQVCWNNASNGAAWTGGDIAATDAGGPLNYAASLGTVTLNDSFGWKSYSSAELTTLINAMYQGATDNNGFLLNPGAGYLPDVNYRFASSENATTENQPKLTLTIVSAPATATIVLLLFGALGFLRRRR